MRFRLLAACLLLTANLARPMQPAEPPPGPVFIAAYADVKPKAVNAARKLMSGYVRDSRADAGNVGAFVLQDIEHGSKFVVVEIWKDRPSFAAHEQASHTQEFRAQFKPLGRIPYDQGVHHGLDVDPMPAASAADSLFVVTHVDVRSQRESTEAELAKLAQASRSDAGHVRYDVYQQDPTRTNHFTLFTVWSSRKAYDAHAESPHWQRFTESIAPLIGAPYDDRLFTRLRD